NIILRTKVGAGSWAVVRQVAYTYYDGVEAHGNAGDLKLAVVEDASGNALDTKYYRYYVTESGGYQHALKYVFNPQSYPRLVAASGLKWETFQKFDGSGRLILTAMPSAITGYDDTKADLLNSVNGNYQYMSDNSGLIYVQDYGTSTTATSSTPGDVIGYLKDT